ncbi:MAG: SPFH domain-containing protein [Bacilli bacterium]|nr:SPFH domain-containing protein [Bacilli bacterium]
MGLIKALTTSVSTALGDQFKEFVNIPSVDGDTLIIRGKVEHGPANTNPSEGVISNGSKIVVPQGWAMMLVDNGKVEFSSEPGEYIYDNSSEPSVFYGGLGKGIMDTFRQIGGRFTFAGQTAKDQRVYYINLLEKTGNKFGSTSPKEIYDSTYGMTIQMTFRGNYSFKVDNPLALVLSVIGANPRDKVTFGEIFDDQFKSDVNEQMHKALTIVMEEKKIRFSSIGAYGSDLSAALNTVLNQKWINYGLLITAVSMEDIGATDEYIDIIKGIEKDALNTRMQGQANADATRAMAGVYSEDMAGAMGAATADAMRNASSNDKGALLGFAGLNMAQQAGNNVLGTVAGMGGQPNQAAPAPQGGNGAVPNFCPNCGAPTNGTNFCGNCGAKLN